MSSRPASGRGIPDSPQTMNPTQADTEQKHSIIACPSCHTKFAVLSNTLASASMPRFHCSRCDYVFTQEQEDFISYIESEEDEQDTPPPTASEMNTTSASQSDIPNAWSSPCETSFSTEPATGLATAGRWSSLQVPREHNAAVAQDAPHEEPMSPPSSPAGREGQIQFDFGWAETSPSRPGDLLEDRAPVESGLGDDALRQYRTTDQSMHDSPPYVNPIKPSYRLEKNSSIWRNFVMVSSPLFLILFALGVCYLLLKQNPTWGEHFALNFYPDLRKAPPAGLLLDDLKHRRISLESGETVHLITGKISNDTQERFQDIQIEGLGFDSSGRKLTSTVVSASSSLNKARIRSLSPEMISEIQGREGALRYELTPDEEQEFTLALLDDTMRDARYFSARVYSVRN